MLQPVMDIFNVLGLKNDIFTYKKMLFWLPDET